MKDKRIISVISNVYLMIMSLLLFILVSLCVLFIVLKDGLYIDNISLQNIKAKQLYIKWNKSLDVSIKEIHITENSEQEKVKIELSDISNYLKKISHFYNIFEEFSVNKITYNNLEASFNYEKGGNGYILVSSPDFTFNSSLYFQSGLLNIQINEYKDRNRDIKLSGSVILDPKLQTFTSSVIIDLKDEMSLNLLIFTNENKLYYKIKSLEDIKSISYAIELLDLPKDLNYWAYEAIKFSSLTLKNAYGWVDFKDLDNAYKNVYIHATGHDLSYAYNQNLDAIHTKKTILEFKEGTLYIYPKEARTYKSKLGESWLKIDFTLPQELLTLKLLFDGKLDKETLGILEEFKIKVPLLQNTGKTKVDLSLKINLQTMHIDAQGVFFTRVANFRYAGHNINVFNTKVELNNYDIRIKKMLAKYQDIIDTEIDFKYNAKSGEGTLDFNLKKININALGLTLNPKNKSLKARYLIEPGKDLLSVDKSYWNFKNNTVKVNKISIPINLHTLKVKIPSTQIHSKQLAKAYVSGDIDLKKLTANLDLNLKEIYFRDIQLTKKDNAIKVIYDKSFTLQTSNTLKFTINSEKSFLSPTTLELKNNQLTLHETYINIGNLIKTKICAKYDIKKKRGHLKTRRARFSTRELGLLYFNKDGAKFDITVDKKGNTKITSQDLKIAFVDTKDMWKLKLSSLNFLSLNSEFLKKYHLQDGFISLEKKKTNKDIDIKIVLKYPYPLIIKNNKEIYDYVLKGSFNTTTNALNATLNDDISINMHDALNIKVKDIGINMNAILDIKNSLKGYEKKPSSLQVNVNTQDSYIYISENRRILSDKMYLYYESHILTVGLLYKEAISGLKYENNKFHAYGKNFNDEFMDNLFALSDFDGGQLAFNLSGNTQKYEGIFTINDTIILDYKVLNNVLAFVNTIPSLVTFSTPGYNSKGLHLETAYMKFTSQNDIFNLSDIYFHSRELDIIGKGLASFKTNKIDLVLKLTTDIGSTVAKIPIVGYLFLDEDSLSSTLKVSGALDNPTIDTLIGEEIVVAPLKLLLRALTLPYYLITQEEE